MLSQACTIIHYLKICRSRVVAHAFDPSTWEAEWGGSLILRPAWSQKTNTLSQKKPQQQQPQNNNEENLTKQKTSCYSYNVEDQTYPEPCAC